MREASDFEERTIELFNPAGPVRCLAWCLGSLGISEFEADKFGYTITHLPTGASLRQADCNFATLANAQAACREIAQVFDWSNTELVTRERGWIGLKVREIASRHNGSPLVSSGNVWSSKHGYLNGFEAPATAPTPEPAEQVA